MRQKIAILQEARIARDFECIYRLKYRCDKCNHTFEGYLGVYVKPIPTEAYCDVCQPASTKINWLPLKENLPLAEIED